MSSKQWRWIPNALTFMRMVLIVPFAGALLEGNYRLSLVIFFVAALTDAFDGFLARHFNWRSRLGAVADPLADKALLISAYLMLTITGVLPLWLFAWCWVGILSLSAAAWLFITHRPLRYGTQYSGQDQHVCPDTGGARHYHPAGGFAHAALGNRHRDLAGCRQRAGERGHYVAVWSLRAWRAKRS